MAIPSSSSPQSTQSMFVDMAIVAGVVFLAWAKITDAAPWAMFSVMVGARFGIAAGKLSQSSIGGSSYRPPPNSGE